MDKLAPLLEQLAEKLGTTVEYLWGVLIKQASVTVIVNIGVNLIFVCLIIFLIVLGKKLTSKLKPTEDNKYPKAIIEDDDGVFFTWAGIIVVVTISFFIILLSSGEIVNALCNPEYWALKEVLSMVGK